MTKMVSEEGVILSGGQNQKLFLARALHKDSPILILDEPTAALDPIAESEVYEQYNKYSSGKSSIFI
jgi:ATP-binding cassette subfamily B protein